MVTKPSILSMWWSFESGQSMLAMVSVIYTDREVHVDGIIVRSGYREPESAETYSGLSVLVLN